MRDEKEPPHSSIIKTANHDNRSLIVMKFGGSSLESASAIRRVAAIVNTALPTHPVVVVSAMGKVTSRMLATAEHAAEGNIGLALQELRSLESYHADIVSELLTHQEAGRLTAQIAQHFLELYGWISAVALLGQVTPFLSDAISSFGERLSSEIVTAVLKGTGVPAVHLDARRLILTDSRHTQAVPLVWETYARIRRAVAQAGEEQVPVLGGFIAADEAGETTTLGRGGSDWTASLVGAALNAGEIQIWTDVDGMLTCDPRIHQGGYRLRAISYEEAAEMARLGAKVLHPETVAPAVRARIPVVIRNSRRPGVEGTQIASLAPASENTVRSVTSQSGLTLLHIRPRFAEQLLTLAVQAVFARFQVTPEWLDDSADGCTAAIPSTTPVSAILDALALHATVTAESGQALLGLVGEQAGHTPVALSRALRALSAAHIPVNATCRKLISVRLLLAEDQARSAVAHLHAEFFTTLDPALFASAAEAASEAESLQPAVACVSAR